MSEALPFGRVFREHEDSEGAFPGFLLVNHGRAETADQRELARAYAEISLKAVDYALENLDTPEAAFPALYLTRHTLELTLKGLVPDWRAHKPKGKSGHQIDPLIKVLRTRLIEDGKDEVEVASLARFMRQFAMIDPQSMAFRFTDGAVVSFGDAPLDDPEIWVDFRALRQSLELIVKAIDRLWRLNSENRTLPHSATDRRG